MTPIVDGLRYELPSRVPRVEYVCPVCEKRFAQVVRVEDTEGSLVGMMPHDNCKDAEVLVRVR